MELTKAKPPLKNSDLFEMFSWIELYNDDFALSPKKFNTGLKGILIFFKDLLVIIKLIENKFFFHHFKFIVKKSKYFWNKKSKTSVKSQ
jgi:hypothetical protein